MNILYDCRTEETENSWLSSRANSIYRCVSILCFNEDDKLNTFDFGCISGN